MSTVVSLFAGIEGIGLAFHRAGYRIVAAVEIDDAARGVIADRMPATTLLADVCEVTPDELRAAGFDPRDGVLVAGWPCTDLSVAGRRLGLAGTRSGLFFEIVRLAAGLRPRWLCLENVPGLLSATCPCPGRPDSACGGPCSDGLHQMPGGACGPGRCIDLHGGAMGTVLGALADLGYGLAWRVLDAQHFGVPQRRRRVVLVGCLGDGAAPVQVLLEPEGGARDSAPRRPQGPGTAPVAALRAGSGGGCGPDDNDATGGRLIVGPLQAEGADGRGHRLDAEGAATGHLVVAAALTARQGKGVDSDAIQTLVPQTAHALRSHPGGVGQGHNTTYVAEPVALHENQRGEITTSGTAGALKTGGGKPGQGYPCVAHALTAEGADASEDGTGRGTPLVPMAFDWQTDGSDRARPNISTERTSSLQTEKRDAVIVPVQAGAQALASATAVRRLTPTECERLQGLPDDWTATSWGKPQSDSARYRQLGNSVAVPVFEWVARRIREASHAAP